MDIIEDSRPKCDMVKARRCGSATGPCDSICKRLMLRRIISGELEATKYGGVIVRRELEERALRAANGP